YLEKPCGYTLHIAIDDDCPAAECDRGDCGCRIGSDSGQFAQACLMVWKLASHFPDDRVGTLLEVARARILSQSRPGFHAVIGLRACEVGYGWPFLEKFPEIGLHGLYSGLLQHYFREPDVVGFWPNTLREGERIGPPRQFSMVLVVPVK